MNSTYDRFPRVDVTSFFLTSGTTICVAFAVEIVPGVPAKLYGPLENRYHEEPTEIVYKKVHIQYSQGGPILESSIWWVERLVGIEEMNAWEEDLLRRC